MRPTLFLLVTTALTACAGPSIAEDIREQCLEQRANLMAFCSPECRMATAGTGSCATPLPADLRDCVSARGAAMPCPGLGAFADCNAVADCVALQPVDVQQRIFDSEMCVRAATASVCE